MSSKNYYGLVSQFHQRSRILSSNKSERNERGHEGEESQTRSI